jgi:hypothetical protein
VLVALAGAMAAGSAVALAMDWLRAVLVRPSGVDEEEACSDASIEGSGGGRSSGRSSAAASMA